ncbi:stress responsive A/B barrel domain-containing protein [Phyllosticta citriasiana]|uniref:Stress responsive A/B barrel domain-containing protein n=1 Tax=Phyllosticta citriasiana TaxID=595635 RepID=A0ABR1KPZ7_9PEZI
MAIIHIIQFSFKPEVPKEQVDDVCRRILALKDKCIHPTTKKPYIKSFVGGRESSAEGLQGGVTHIFVSEIESDEDRRYYIEKDPAHLDFIKFAGPLIQTARVVDFEPGKF